MGGGRGAAVPPHIVERQSTSSTRFYAMLSFALLTAINGYAWLLFEPIETATMKAYSPHFTKGMTALLGSWQPLVYILLCFPMMQLLIAHNGLTKAMRIGICAELLGIGCKVLSLVPYFRGSLASLILLHSGQILSAVSSPVAIGAPSQLSAEWFPPAERVRATAAGVLSNNFGNAVVYVLVPFIVDAVDDGTNGVFIVLLIEAAAAVVAAFLIFRYMPLYSDAEWAHVEHLPALSSSPPSATSTAAPEPWSPFSQSSTLGREHSVSLSTTGGHFVLDDDDELTLEEDAAAEAAPGGHTMVQIRRFVANYSAVVLFVVYAWTSGAFIAWTALFDHLLLALRLPFSEKFIGTLSFSSTVGYIVGGVISSYVADAHFPRHMKTIIVLCCVLNLGVTTLYATSLPVQEGKLAIQAAEEAMALNVALGKRTNASSLGATAVRLAQDANRSSALTAPEALQVAELGFPFVTSRLRLNLPLGHRQLWWPTELPHDGIAWREVKRERKHALADADDIALKSDEALEEATPSANALLALSFLGGLFNGGSAPLFYEIVAEVTFPLVSEAVSGNLMSVGENVGALFMFQVIARFVSDEKINMCFGIGMAVSTVLAMLVQARYNRSDAYARGIDHAHALKEELRRERQRRNKGERKPLIKVPSIKRSLTAGGAAAASPPAAAPPSGAAVVEMRDQATGHLTAYGTATAE